jgi:hypothetical protein
MTATSLGLNGPVRFLGAYVKHVSSSLGMSVNPSSITVTLVEDALTNAIFTYPTVGEFHTLQIGDNWSFGGIITRYEVDVKNIGGRSIRVTINDPREVMQNAPVIIAPGSQVIVNTIANTQCSVVDIFGGYNVGAFNLSSWNEAGIPIRRILTAFNGGSVAFGSQSITIPRATLRSFGETYRFDLTALEDIVDLDYRVNTNMVPVSNLIEEIAARSAFDWYITSERASDNVIDVTLHVIDRSEDNQEIGLSELMANHQNRVISATSGVELRNELSCMVLQGAPVESMQKVAIAGLANEPIDLAPESGSPTYIMTEDEMRIVLGGRHAWEVWLSIPENFDGGGGLSRYGGSLVNEYLRGITGEDATQLLELIKSKNLVKHPERVVNNYINNLNAGHILAGKIYEKLHSHAQASYGKRFVHNDVFDEIIDSCWTRDVVDGDNDPYEHFRQQDGRTRAFVEFTVSDSGGSPLDLGVTFLTDSFGNQAEFRNVTKFGDTFDRLGGSRLFASGVVLDLEKQTVDLTNVVIDMDRSAYTFNRSTSTQPTDRTSLYCACTVDKDGVVRIESPLLEAKPSSESLINLLLAATSGNSSSADSDADGKPQTSAQKVIDNLKRIYTPGSFEIHSLAYQPKNLYVPTRSRYLRYGPVFPTTLQPNTEGRLEIVQDDGFAPWEFGGFALMLEAMQLKVDSAISSVREVFSGTIVVEGFPQYNLGDALERNANINNMSISFGDGGVTTTYNLQTFTRKFGQFTKEDWTRLAIFANNGGARLLPKRLINFIENHRVGVNKQYTGRGSSGGNPTTGGAGNLG